MDLTAWIAPAVVIALIGALVQFLHWWSNRGKVKAEAIDTLSGAAIELLEPYRAEVRGLRDEIGHLREQVGTLEGHLRGRDAKLDEQANTIESHMRTIRDLLGRLEALGTWAHNAHVAMVAANIAAEPPPMVEHELESGPPAPPDA